MNIELDEATQRQADRLTDLLDLQPEAGLSGILEHAVLRIMKAEDTFGRMVEAEGTATRERERADRAEDRLDEALPIIHASHGGTPLVDLSLCPHPTCTRFHHG